MLIKYSRWSLVILVSIRVAHIRSLKELENKNVAVWLVTASDQNSISTFRNEYQLSLPVYFADATVIKTIIRSNPGLVLLQEGTVRAKWHYKDVPEINDILGAFKELPASK